MVRRCGTMGKRNADNEHINELSNKKTKITEDSFLECKQNFVLTRETVEHSVLTDLSLKKWRIGKPIGTLNSSIDFFFF